MLSALTGITAYYLDKQQKAAQARAQEILEQEQKQGKVTKAADEPISTALRMDLIRLEIGYGLLTLINEEANKLYKQVKREIDKRNKKLEKFVLELDKANTQLLSKDYGVLLQSYLYMIKKGDKEI